MKTTYLGRRTVVALVAFCTCVPWAAGQEQEAPESQQDNNPLAAAAKGPQLTFWEQSFVREGAYARILGLPLHQNEDLKKFRGLYFKKLAEGMDPVEVNAKMETAFQRYNQAHNEALTQLRKNLFDIASDMLPYKAPPYTEDEFVYVAMGASLSLGAGANPASNGWVYRVGDRLRERYPNVRVRNLSGGGKTTEHAREVQLPQALACLPDLVTYTAGLNDLQYGLPVEQARENTEHVLKTLREQTDAKIVMTRISVGQRLPALATDVPKFQARRPNFSPERVAAFDAAYTELATKYNVTLVDIGNLTDPSVTDIQIDALFSYDGVHPNNLGHAKIADTLWKAINETLDTPK